MNTEELLTELDRDVYPLEKLPHIRPVAGFGGLPELTRLSTTGTFRKTLYLARLSVIYMYKSLVDRLYNITIPGPSLVKILHRKSVKMIRSRDLQYSMDGDRFHNFLAGGTELGITSVMYAITLMAKQWISLNDFYNGKDYEIDILEEKAVDCICYLTFIGALYDKEVSNA